MEQKYADIIKLGTSALSDAMDRLGIPGQALGIKPIDRSFRVCGPAFTIHNMPVDIHGGYGCMEEYAVSRYMRDSIVLGPSAGTSDIMKVIIARWALS